jgi:spermidine synthase
VSRRAKAVLFALFTLTGFSALTLQVVWQRVISMHAGVDLFSFTTVVSAFLAGLGLGSLAGGALADRLGPRRSLLAFSLSNAGIGLFALVSIRLFYDLYRALVPHVDGTLPAFGFHFLLLVVPTTLMGLSLPLVAKGVVERVQDAGALVGRLYAVNTVGAGIGAAVSGWILLGRLGFVGTVRLAGTLNLVAALLIFTLWRLAGRAGARAGAGAGGDRPEAAVPSPSAVGADVAAPPAARVWPWFVVYGLTGAVALGLEVVFFRVVDALMRSNSYTFGHVLMLYLVLFGAGAAVASRFVRRVARPDRWFLGLQFGVGLAALGGVMVLVYVPALLGIDGPLRSHFSTDGYNLGIFRFSPPGEAARWLFAHVGGPLLVMGAPVLLMGASFPFVQAVVAQRVDTLGRRTGTLLFANIAGNVLGTLLVGFLLIGWLGTSGTFRALAAVLVVPGVAAALAWRGRRPAGLALAAGAVVLMTAAVAAFPSNRALWVYFHSAQDVPFHLAEDRACVNALKEVNGEDYLFINATSQNAYPFDDFHVLIGLLPALTHPRPAAAMAVGLGIGATPYGMALDARLDTVDVVEICGGEVDLLEGLAARGAPELRRLFADDRVDIHVGDGRKFLLSAAEGFDVVTVDVVRPQSAFSGNLYSVEFYELVRDRLAEGGILAQWAASARALNSAAEVFPYVTTLVVESYHGSMFFLASEEPIPFDRQEVLRRLDASLAGPAGASLDPGQAGSIRAFMETVEPRPLRTGGPPGPVDDRHLNHDLFPLDEYFLNHSSEVPIRPPS